MATAPRPGSTRPAERPDEHVRFVFADGAPDEYVDMRTITMADRRTVKHALRGLFGDDTDPQDGLMGALWVHMRRSDPTVDLGELYDRVSIVSLTADADDQEATYDNPEA